MTRLRQWPGLVFVLVVVWKLALALATVQPIPANDSFFYDGPVVNYIAHGKYVNPSLALAFPISGNQVFSAYPPLYQGVLLPWMTIFGTSAFSAVMLHVLLFGIFAALLYLLLMRLQVPLFGMHMAAAFLFAITFHDRPDSLAHVLGVGALLGWASWCSGRSSRRDDLTLRSPALCLGSSILVILCIATSVQIGAAYAFIAVGCMASWWVLDRRRVALFSILTIIVVPLVAVGAVQLGFPLWWNGFIEHARQTPSFTGLRFPEAGDFLKILKAVPGALLVGLAVLAWISRGGLVACLKSSRLLASADTSAGGILKQVFGELRGGVKMFTQEVETCRVVLFFWSLFAALLVIFASLFFLTANSVAIVTYLQPLTVGVGLALFLPHMKGARSMVAGAVLAGAVVFAGTRAIGMTTWGLAVAADVGYADALRHARAALNDTKPGQTVVLSAAYLYDASHRSDLKIVHSDWLGPARPRGVTVPVDEDIRQVKPSLLILTQFDYHRRYVAVIDSLRGREGEVRVKTHNTSRLSVPDSNPLLQRVIQHVSWAPVVVELSWGN